MNPSHDRSRSGSPADPAHSIVPVEASASPARGWSPPPSPAAWAATPAEAGPPASPFQIDPIALLKSLRRRWRLAAPLALVLGATAAAVVWFLIPASKYTAASRLLIPETAPRFMYETREAKSNYGIFRQTQVVRIKSQRVVANALKYPEVQALDAMGKHADPEEWLRQALKVEFPSGAEILEISMSGQEPESLATLVNAVTDAYLAEVDNVDYKARLDRLEKLRGMWKTFNDEVLKKRAKLRSLAGETGPAGKAAERGQKLVEDERQAAIRAALIQVQSELMKAETELEALESVPREELDEPLVNDVRHRVNQELDRDPEMIDHADRINQLETQYKSLVGAARAPSKDAAGTQIRRELEVERKALAERAARIRPAIEREILARSEAAPSDGLATLRSQVALMKRLEEKYLKEIDQLKEERVDLNRHTFDQGMLQAELELDEKAARDMGDEIKHAEIELDKAPRRIQNLERATPPRVKEKDKRPLMAGGAGVGVFCLIALAIGFWEHQARRITSADEVAYNLGLPVVGSIPRLPNAGRSAGSLNAPESSRRSVWNNILIESVDATRTMLLRATRTEGLRVVMITSANVGEGKSTLAGHLATSLARSGRRVLLIDGDLRRPIAHRVYDVPLSPGVCEWLRDETPFEAAIRETAAPNLWLAPAGLCDATALAELSRRDLRRLFDDLKETYDYVIVDSSPVLPVVDATVIGQQVDATLLSVMNERSRVPEVQETHELLGALGIRVLGAVMAGIKTRRSQYSSYAYYGVARGADPLDQG